MTAPLVAALASRLGHPVEVLETHISWVLLAGGHAIKIKKPVNLGFVDFTTLESRRLSCVEELRLGRRTAPDLYEAVVPVTGTREAPELDGKGTPIEWAVRMRRFPQAALLDRLAKAHALGNDLIDALAGAVAAFHAESPRAAPSSAFGTPEEVRAEAEGNFSGIREHAGVLVDPARLDALHGWTVREGERLGDHFARRHAGGFVRECHGDLHLGNVVLLEGRPVPFDAIEFSERLRWIDVMNEVAFTAMDLDAHGLPRHARRFIDAYLSRTGDYEGLAALRYYHAYRALVRAKVAAIRHEQAAGDDIARAKAAKDFERHVALAEGVLAPRRPALVAMHGLPGSGKSTLARELLEALGGVRIRSDVERKRVHGLGLAARTASPPGQGLYDRAADARTTARILEAAGQALDAGQLAIIDATTARREDRAVLRELAHGRGVPFVIVSCEARIEVLRERVAAREREGRDASEAGLAVLDHQVARFEPLTREETATAVLFDGDRGSGSFVALTEGVRARLA